MGFDIGQIRAGHRRFSEANKRMVARVADRAATTAKRAQHELAQFKHRRGSTKRGARAKIIRLKSGRRIRIYNVAKTKSGAPLATFLELGTRPHIIRAKRGRALRFFWVRMGRMMTVRQVNHPGTRAYRFIRTAADHASQELKADLSRAMHAIAREF